MFSRPFLALEVGGPGAPTSTRTKGERGVKTQNLKKGF